jgi:hypothetical protein
MKRISLCCQDYNYNCQDYKYNMEFHFKRIREKIVKINVVWLAKHENIVYNIASDVNSINEHNHA